MDSSHSTTLSLLTALLLLCATGLLPASTFAQQDDITVTVPEVEPDSGQTVTLSVEVDLGSEEVGSYTNMEFTFDSSILTIEDVRDGDELSFGESNFTDNQDGDTLRVSNIADDSPVTGSGEFLKIDVTLTESAGIPFELTPSDTEGIVPTSVFETQDGTTLTITSIDQGSVGQLAEAQFIHNAADPAADTVDVYLDDQLIADDLGFREATSFVDGLASGVDTELGVAPSNSGSVEDTISSQTVTFTPGEAHTTVANGVLTPDDFADNPDGESIGLEFFVEPGAKSTASSGDVDLRAVHGATDAPTVDIDEDGTTLFDNLTYGNVTQNYLSATAEQKVLAVTQGSSDELVAAFDADLSGLGGTAATVLASGFLDPSANQDGSDFALIAALPDGSVVTFEAADAEAQLIHNAADPNAQTVDIYIGEEKAVDDFSFRTATSLLEVPAASDIKVGVAPSNSSTVEDTLASQAVTFEPGSTYTVVANGVLDPSQFADNPDGESIGFEFFVEPEVKTTAESGEVDLRTVHGATDAPTVDIGLEDGATLLEGLAYGDVTPDYLSATAEEKVLTVTPSSSDTPIAAFQTDLSGLDGNAGTVLASGFLDPSANQDGPTFALIVALPDGTVMTLDEATAEAQFIHNTADPAADTVDIYLDDELEVDDFSFRSATSFIEVPAAVGVDVGVAPGDSEGPNDILESQMITFNSDEAHTVVANGVLTPDDFADNPDGEPIAFEFFSEPGADSTASSGEVDLRAVHGATDAPTVDIDENSTTLLDDLTYGDVTADYLAATAEEKRLVVTPGDSETVVASFDADLSSLGGSAATMLASGFLDPSANQDGAAFALIAALPNGNVITFPPADVIPIQQARQQGPDSTVTVEGTVSRAFGDFVRFQDQSGPTGASGLVVRQTSGSFHDDIQDGTITQGTQLQVSGTLSEFNGLLQINDDPSEGVDDLDGYTVQGQGAPPAAQDVSFSDLQAPDGEDYESELVRVESVLFVNPGATGDTLNAETSYDVQDGDGTTFTYRVQDSSETAVIGRDVPGGTFTYEGVVGEFGGEYQLIPVRTSSGLPVEMAGFEATRSGSSVALRWSTASESNNAGFRVQHEPVGQNGWQALGFVESRADGGTTSEAQSYRFSVERDLEPGTHRFRLKQVDLDGSTSPSKVVSVEVPVEGALTLSAPSPNPVSAQAAVQFAVKESAEAEVVLYDLLGQKVRTLYQGIPQAGQSKTLTVETDGLPSGVYVMQLRADGQTRTQRLTVVR